MESGITLFAPTNDREVYHLFFCTYLERCLQEKGFAVMRDNRAIGYKGLIKEYMQRLGRGNCIILVLSDQYFKSPNCMYELLEIAQQPDFQKRIFPVVVDGTLFYRPEDRLKYLTYWDEEKTRLQEDIRKIPNLANLHGITDDLDLYDDIRRNIARLLDFLRNLNTYPLQGGNYELLLEAIQANMPQAELDYSRLPIDFSSKIEFLTQDFVGRQDAMARIDRFIQTHSSGYLAIVGEAGIGKSALLAHEVKKRGAVHHFVDDKQNSAKDEVFLRSIVGQLQQQYGFEFEERTPISVSEWNIYFHKWIKEISAEEQLVIFVDALDEAQHYGGSDNLLKYLPQELPENVYFILSSRPEFKKEDITFLDSTVFEHYDLPPFTQADIEAYLAVRSSRFSSPLPGGVGVGNLTEASTTSQIAAILYHKSEGNPLYLHYLLQECENENLTLEQISQLPQGLMKFYEKQWHERIWIGEKASKEGRKQLLCLLLLLKGPASEELLRELTDFDRAELQEYLTPLRWFMRTGDRYAIFHNSFKNFLRFQFEKAVSQSHKQLIERLTQWQALEGDLQMYALAWLPAHLFDTQQEYQLFTLARDEMFRQAQTQVFPDSPTRALRPLQLALQRAAESDNAVAMAEFLVAHARLTTQITQETPLDALRKGNLKRAWELADLQNIERCIKWHLLLAWELHDTGHNVDAQATLRRLQTKTLPCVCDQILDPVVEDLLVRSYAIDAELSDVLYQRLIIPEEFDDNFCITLCEYGQLDVAQMYVSRLDQESQHRVLGSIARRQARDGNVAGAFATMERIADNEQRAYALGAIALAQAQAGDHDGASTMFAEAIAIAKQIKDKEERIELLGTIATAQAQTGDNDGASTTFAEAIAIAKQIKDKEECIELLGTIATAQAEAGDVTGAFALLDRISDKQQRVRVLSALARTQIQTGDDHNARAMIAEAIKTAKQIKEEEDRAEALGTIATVQAQSGNSDGSHVTFKAALAAVPKEWGELPWYAGVLSGIAAMQAQVGDVTGAFMTVDRITDEQVFAEALCTIATIQTEAGDRNGARTTFATTIAASGTVRGKWCEWALKEIAVLQMRVGDVTGAFRIGDRIADKQWREWTLQEIATMQAQVGDISGAFVTVKQIKDKKAYAKALQDIAAIQTQRGEHNDARTTFMAAITRADRIKDKNDRIEALSSIAQAQAQAGDIAGALATAKRIASDKEDRARALAKIAAAQAEAGDVTDALTTVRDIANKYWKVMALGAVAVAQAQFGTREEARATFDTALTTIQGIEAYAWDHERALVQIAAAQAQTGDIAGALKTAKNMGEALVAIAAAQAQAGDIIGALNKAQRIKADRDEALQHIAMAQVQAGDLDGARTTLATAVGATKQIAVETKRAWVLKDIARTQVQIGSPDDALRTAEMILIAHNQLLPAIADAFTEKGDKEHFKRLLLPCAYYLDAAYKMCGLLARLYPEQATAIVEILLQQEHLNKKRGK